MDDAAATLRLRVHAADAAPDAAASHPVLVSFSGGAPAAAQLGGGGAHAVAFEYLRGAKASRAARRELTAESDVVGFAPARNYGAGAAAFKCGGARRLRALRTAR